VVWSFARWGCQGLRLFVQGLLFGAPWSEFLSWQGVALGATGPLRCRFSEPAAATEATTCTQSVDLCIWCCLSHGATGSWTAQYWAAAAGHVFLAIFFFAEGEHEKETLSALENPLSEEKKPVGKESVCLGSMSLMNKIESMHHGCLAGHLIVYIP
jgi:hypothetical protein